MGEDTKARHRLICRELEEREYPPLSGVHDRRRLAAAALFIDGVRGCNTLDELRVAVEGLAMTVLYPNRQHVLDALEIIEETRHYELPDG